MNNLITGASVERAIRNFLATIVGYIIIAAVQAFTGLQAVPINFSNIQGTAKALLIAFVVAFLTGLGKAIRDKWGDPKSSTAGTINKLPI